MPRNKYVWNLTADELNTIWYAVCERKDRLAKELRKTEDLELRQIKNDLIKNCYDLQCQINDMRSRHYI